MAGQTRAGQLTLAGRRLFRNAPGKSPFSAEQERADCRAAVHKLRLVRMATTLHLTLVRDTLTGLFHLTDAPSRDRFGSSYSLREMWGSVLVPGASVGNTVRLHLVIGEQA